jgi:uncharacterized protein YukE
VINLPGLAELQRMIGTLEAALSRVGSFGDPGQLAGDPATIRGLAAAHRRAANALRTMQDDGHSWAAGISGGALWEGTASGAFMGYWSDVHGRVDELASNHERMASSLESIAEESERFNSDALTAVVGIRSWLAAAPGAVLGMDTGEITRLLGQGNILISHLERLTGDVEQFAGRMVQMMSIDLDFARRQVDKMAIQPIRRGIIKDPIPPQPNPREIIPTPDHRPKPNIMAIGGFALGPLITSPDNIPGLSNILRSYQPPPQTLPGFPDATPVKRRTPVQGGGGLRKRWRLPDGRILEWDSQHGAVEMYDKRGRHLGEYDPRTGAPVKPPDQARKVQP